MRVSRPGPVSLASALAGTLLLTGAVALATIPDVGWQDTYDGGPGLPDQGIALMADAQGDLVVAGESTDWDGAADLFVRKLSRADGHQLWGMTWGDSGGNSMAMSDVVLDPSGDVMVGGYIRGCVG